MKSMIAPALLIFAMMFFSCQKEYSIENDGLDLPATGTLKSGTSGDCLQSKVNGIFKEGMLLDKTNYIDIQVDVASIGNYNIVSDTINGFSFKATGIFTSTGLNTVRLLGNGKPVSAATNSFTITFGTGKCVLDILVISAATVNAVYSFDSAPGSACSGAILNGTYHAGTLLDASNTVTLSLNVTTAGTYSISTTPTNGITFATSGVFTAKGVQTVTLTASGTPVSAGNSNITAGNGTSSCTFTVSVLPSADNVPAVYTLGLAGSNCTGVVLAGTYISGTAMTASNTVKIDVNVTAIGTYTIGTNSVNNVSFSATGTFTQTGVQKVTLTAKGTPATEGTHNFLITANANTCSFPITFTQPAKAAEFTLSGTPGACGMVVINGAYQATVPLSISNTIIVKANVTVPGTYTISTNIVNGMKFTSSGTFISVGTGIDVVLTGTGTPVVAGTNTFTPQGGTSGCTFDIVVEPAPAVPAGIYSCKIDGVFFSFYDRAEAKNTDTWDNSPYLYLDGFTAPPNGEEIPELQIFITNNNKSVVKVGSYNVDGLLLPNGYRIEIDYHVVNSDMSVDLWNTSSSFFSPNPPFTINVSSVSATRVKGTFSGKLTNILQGSTMQKTVTEGVFDLPIQ